MDLSAALDVSFDWSSAPAMSESTVSRESAIRLARFDPEAALAVARRVPDPWFRCQALAWVAWYVAEPRVQEIVEEAVLAARHSEEAYRAVAVLAWPIRASLERGHRPFAAALLSKALCGVPGIDLLVSRVDALFLLTNAVFCDDGLRAAVLPTLQEVCSDAPSWKGGWVLRLVTLMLAGVDGTAAQSLLQGMPDGKYRRSAARLLAEGRTESPRSFFWDPDR